ncbi:unnamed protein product [Caenorhabditis brenneri]
MGILDHPSSSGSQSASSTRGLVSSSTSSSTSGPLGIDWRKWFPPVTSRSFLSHYLPASGAISHTLYTVHLFSPNIISSLFPTGDLAVSNTILFNANVGLGFYVYFRRHLHRVNPWERVEFSVLSSTLFNFGSLLAAVLIKALFPAKSPTWLKSLTATVLSGYLLSRAAKYMGLLDHRVNGRGSVSPARSVLSPRQTAPAAVSANGTSNSSAHHIAQTPPPSGQLHISTSPPPSSQMPRGFESSTILETPPQSSEGFIPMTPSATEASEFGGTPSEDCVEAKDTRQNYRYLHSYALNNLNHGAPKKETILRRTTMGVQAPQALQAGPQAQTPARPKTQPMCFVTPEPSLKAEDSAVYTPPPSRLEVPKRAAKPKRASAAKPKKALEDDLDRYIDFAIDHAPFALVPIAVGCWMTGTVPLWSTLKFIFVE